MRFLDRQLADTPDRRDYPCIGSGLSQIGVGSVRGSPVQPVGTRRLGNVGGESCLVRWHPEALAQSFQHATGANVCRSPTGEPPEEGG